MLTRIRPSSTGSEIGSLERLPLLVPFASCVSLTLIVLWTGLWRTSFFYKRTKPEIRRGLGYDKRIRYDRRVVAQFLRPHEWNRRWGYYCRRARTTRYRRTHCINKANERRIIVAKECNNEILSYELIQVQVTIRRIRRKKHTTMSASEPLINLPNGPPITRRSWESQTLTR